MLGSIAKYAGFAVVLVAALVAYKPEIVLKLPMGFIPYAILGHNVPPYFVYDAYEREEFANWTKDGDVIVSVAAKSGTNLMLYMNHLIRAKGDLEK